MNDYKKMGGRVTTGSDSGFIYQTYGFGYINELEMLQEAGFHPLEVIQAATMNGAITLAEPKAKAPEFGVVRSRHACGHGDRRSEPAAELQGALRDRRAEAERQDRAGRAGRRRALHDQGRNRLRREALLADVAAMVEKQKRATKTTTTSQQR